MVASRARKGILFSPPLVRAIRAGNKTVTRRMVPAPPTGAAYLLNAEGTALLCYALGTLDKNGQPTPSTVWVPPIPTSADHRRRTVYAAGDVLYLKEAWSIPRAAHHWTQVKPEQVRYSSTEAIPSDYARKHARFMPRSFARTFICVESLVLERTHDITDDEAIREGMTPWTKDGALWKYAPPDLEGTGPLWPWVECPRSARDAFIRYWCGLHGEASWRANPQVQCIRFRVVSDG